jgi:hypothetical protein
MERVIRRREGAARYRGDGVDLVQQEWRSPSGVVTLDVARRLEHAVGKRRRTLAPAGKGHYHEQLVGV